MIDYINSRPPAREREGDEREMRGRRYVVPWPDDVKCSNVTKISGTKDKTVSTIGIAPPVNNNVMASLDVECVSSDDGTRIGNTIVSGIGSTCDAARSDAIERVNQRDVCRYTDKTTNLYSRMGSNKRWLQTLTCPSVPYP